MQNKYLKLIILNLVLAFVVSAGAQTSKLADIGIRASKAKQANALISDYAGSPTSSKNLLEDKVFRGGVNGGGGDEVALQMQRALFRALNRAKTLSPPFYETLRRHRLVELFQEVEIWITDEDLSVESKNLVQKSAAYNQPSEKIVLMSRQRWKGIKDLDIEEAIILHELASIRKVERTGFYPLTSKYLQIVGSDMKGFDQGLSSAKTISPLEGVYDDDQARTCSIELNQDTGNEDQIVGIDRHGLVGLCPTQGQIVYFTRLSRQSFRSTELTHYVTDADAVICSKSDVSLRVGNPACSSRLYENGKYLLEAGQMIRAYLELYFINQKKFILRRITWVTNNNEVILNSPPQTLTIFEKR